MPRETNGSKFLPYDKSAPTQQQWSAAAIGRDESAGKFLPQVRNRGRCGWVVRCADDQVAARVAHVLGGERTATASETAVTVYDDVGVVMDGADLTDINDLLPRPHRDDGAQCRCTAYWRKRRGAAQLGYGPVPTCEVGFRLAEAPALGRFVVLSSSWDFAASIPHLRAELADSPTRTCHCQLRLVREEHPTEDGRLVTYHRPAVIVSEKPA
jgi:hypothetical protein